MCSSENSLNFIANDTSVWARLHTVHVSVRFFTILKEIAGKKQETLLFRKDQCVTINLILEKLSRKYGKDFDKYVYVAKGGEVKGFLQFLINGRSVSPVKELDTELCDGDILAIVPPVGGG